MKTTFIREGKEIFVETFTDSLGIKVKWTGDINFLVSEYHRIDLTEVEFHKQRREINPDFIEEKSTVL